MAAEVRNEKKMIGFSLLLVISIVGCVAAPEPPTATTNVVLVTSPANYSEPLIYGWGFGKETLINLDGTSFAVLGIQLSGTETKLFYALSGKDITQFLEEYSILIENNNSQAIDLINVNPLATIKGFDLGFMNFMPRIPGTTELVLRIIEKGNQAKDQMISLARFDGPSSKDRLFSTYFAGKEGGIELNGYQIRMIFTLPISEKAAIEQLPVLGTPMAISEAISQDPNTSIADQKPPWSEVPKGVQVDYQYAFSVEDTKEKLISYLGFQLLNDGSAIAAFEQSVTAATPIWVATPTPTSAYPPPYP